MDINTDPKKESEKKSLNQKLEDLKKEFESKKKKYTLTEEKFGKNEKLESASYKLLFFNPRGPVDKRLMRIDLDLFYRPVKVGFEEEWWILDFEWKSDAVIPEIPYHKFTLSHRPLDSIF